MAEVDFSGMKKDELVGLAKKQAAQIAELSATPDTNDQAVPGMIQVLSLWGTDPQGQPYKDKNGRRYFVGQIQGRVFLSANAFKTAGSRQPDLRGSLMPYRPQENGDGSDVFDDLTGGDGEEVNPLM